MVTNKASSQRGHSRIRDLRSKKSEKLVHQQSIRQTSITITKTRHREMRSAAYARSTHCLVTQRWLKNEESTLDCLPCSPSRKLKSAPPQIHQGVHCPPRASGTVDKVHRGIENPLDKGWLGTWQRHRGTHFQRRRQGFAASYPEGCRIVETCFLPCDKNSID